MIGLYTTHVSGDGSLVRSVGAFSLRLPDSRGSGDAKVGRPVARASRPREAVRRMVRREAACWGMRKGVGLVGAELAVLN